MAFPQFRWPFGSDSTAAEASTSVETLRRRARQRLLGATLLVVAGVLAFPLLFDTQPRPVALDVPINIPDKNLAPPLALPPADAELTGKSEPAAKPDNAAKAAAIPPQSRVAAIGSTSSAIAPVAPPAPPPAVVGKGLAPGEEEVPPLPKDSKESKAPKDTKASVKPEPKTDTKPKVDAKAKPEPKPEPKPAAKVVAKNDGDRAQSLLEGGPASAPRATNASPAASTNASPATSKAAEPAGAARYVVQVAAFSDAGKAQDVRSKLEKAGIKTYAQMVDTPEGKRYRVRLGPFTSKAEADQAVAKVKAHQLSAVVLTL